VYTYIRSTEIDFFVGGVGVVELNGEGRSVAGMLFIASLALP